MIQNSATTLHKTLQILLPSSNKALQTLLQDSSPSQLTQLTQTKDLKTLLNSLFTASNNQNSQTLLNLLKNNPTFQSLGNLQTTLSETTQKLETLLQHNTQHATLKDLNTVLKNLTHNLETIDGKNLHTKLKNSGIFLESHLKNQEDISFDLKKHLLQAKEVIQTLPHDTHNTLTQSVDKLLLQIDYYQLYSQLQNGATLFLPYSWDLLDDGKLTLKKGSQEDSFICDIELQLKNYQPLELRLAMFEKNQLYITINTQDTTLRSLIQANTQELKTQLAKVNITTKKIRFLAQDTRNNPYTQSSYETPELGFKTRV
jgi:hypothetical protein